MASTSKYKCPVCKKPLTKKEFERALKIHEAQEKHFEHKEREFADKVRRFEDEKKKIKRDARESERARTRRIVGGKVKEIGKLKERIKMLQRGKTPQEGGPEFELKLVRQLRTEFDGDDIQHKGQAGDVLHTVKEGGKIAGVIIYECKWTPGISGSHIRQTAQAKMSRHAQFAVLVTSGTRRGFSGLDEESGVVIVAPAGVLPMAGLLRNHLLEMFRAGIEKKRRTKIANQLLKFIKSPEFKNPIEEVVRTAESLKEGVEEEYRWHVNDWKKRLTAYARIRWDSFSVQENLRRVLRGEIPKQMTQPREKPALPSPVE